MHGLTSRTGVPSIASRPATRNVVPSTASSRQMVTPSRFGRSFPRWAKMPTFGQSVRPRDDGAFCDPIEQEDDLDVRKPVEPGERLGAEVRRQRDRRRHRVPAVVERLDAAAAHAADRAEREEFGGSLGFSGHRLLLWRRDYREPVRGGSTSTRALAEPGLIPMSQVRTVPGEGEPCYARRQVTHCRHGRACPGHPRRSIAAMPAKCAAAEPRGWPGQARP